MQAKTFLRSDLRKLCAMFRGFGRDSLLLSTLAYNVGCGKVMRSRMYAKMWSGNRNIYRDYVDFKRWNGKIVPSIELRRKTSSNHLRSSNNSNISSLDICLQQPSNKNRGRWRHAMRYPFLLTCTLKRIPCKNAGEQGIDSWNCSWL